MKRVVLFLFLFVFSLYSQDKFILIADFNSKEKVNSIGGEFGSWGKDPNDKTQFCREFFQNEKSGYSLGLEYDVDSKNPAYNGFWMKLKGIDLNKYKFLSLKVRGDLKKGFTERFWIEMKNYRKQMGKVLLTGITDKWKEFRIPLFLFTMHPDYAKALEDFSKMDEFVITFDDKTMTKKTGIIYLDDIKFLKGGKEPEEIIIDDFEDGDFLSNLGGEEGTWSVNPDDKSQFCKASFINDTPDKSKNSLVLDYDISSEQIYDEYYPYLAYNGYYIKMNELKLKGGKIYLSFWVKGTTPEFKMEVKTDRKTYKFKVSGVSDKWQEKKLLLAKKKREEFFGPIKELTFVFDREVKDKEGKIFIDNLKFEIK